jgi:hypothetical protein
VTYAQVAHSSFIGGSHTTKNTASGILYVAITTYFAKFHS